MAGFDVSEDLVANAHHAHSACHYVRISKCLLIGLCDIIFTFLWHSYWTLSTHCRCDMCIWPLTRQQHFNCKHEQVGN